MAITEDTSCRDKVQYDTRREAKTAARLTTRKYRLHTYLCEWCHYWHNGRPVGWQSTKRGKRYIDSTTVLDLPEEYVETKMDS